MLAYDSSCDDGSLDNKVRYCRMPDPVCYYKETRLRLKIQLKYMLTQRLSVSVSVADKEFDLLFRETPLLYVTVPLHRANEKK